MYVLVKVFKKSPACVVHTCAYLLVHFRLQCAKRCVDLRRCAAFLVDGKDALFKIHTRLDGAQHFVRGAEDAAKEAELLTQQLKHAVLVAQFPTVGEHYGLVFRLGNPLVSCVNKAIATLKSSGKLAALQRQYLRIYTSFPTIQP